jgi:hypothetical protein
MNARGTTPEVRKALDEAIANGFTVTMFAKTPSDGRSVLNSRAALRRAIRERECDA